MYLTKMTSRPTTWKKTIIENNNEKYCKQNVWFYAQINLIQIQILARRDSFKHQNYHLKFNCTTDQTKWNSV